jgi:mitotic spindle assembly checkpoint protein MAD1
MQQAEGERNKATRQHESLMKELREIKDRAANEKAALERRMREAEEARRVAVEEVEDGRAEMEDRIRGLERGRQELESRNAALKQSIEELRRESEEKDQVLQEAQQGLELKDEQMGNLESEILRLKAQSGDAETLGVIKRELSEQVAHIRTLEATNREQLAELKHFRRLHKSVEVVEEEKRVLQQKVDQMDDLQQELAEARLQRQRLEDERLAWTAYLQSQAGGDSEPEFDSPEAVARALVMARLESASLIEKAGRKEAEVAEKEDIIKTLESEKSKLESQLKKAKGSDSDDKVRLRLERQRALALKEVEYLRAQLKTFDQEESTMELQSYDEAKAKRIQELEDMVTQYRTEVQTVSAELAATPKRNIAPLSSVPAANGKRSRDESDAPAVDQEQLGVLSRKNRKLQDELSAAQTKIAGLQKEVSVLKERLEALTSHAQTRVLELRNNPTAQHEAIKRSTLTSLKDENQALLEQLRNKGKPGTAAVVPLATLERAQRDVSEAALQVADKEKTIRRLKEIWGAKTTEFREGVRSLLGWKVDFLPNGKMRVSSLFLPSSEDGENSIVFDGELGTMKISGGPQSAFARKIRDQIKFWVTERGEIPCLLAQLTLEFYEETTRAARH